MFLTFKTGMDWSPATVCLTSRLSKPLRRCWMSLAENQCRTLPIANCRFFGNAGFSKSAIGELAIVHDAPQAFSHLFRPLRHTAVVVCRPQLLERFEDRRLDRQRHRSARSQFVQRRR